MMRIRLLLIACLTFALPAMAMDVDQQGNWNLRTATSTQITKDYFCASEGKFSNDYGIVLAHNILGQTSLILNWPDFDGAMGSAVPIRISIDKKPFRDAEATLKAPGMLVVPLGWDDDALSKLTDAQVINIAAAKKDTAYHIKDSSKAFTRLNSCTASVIDRLPGSSALSDNTQHVLSKSGLSHAKVIQTVTDKSDTESFLIDGIFGGATTLSGSKADVTQQMLEYIDQLELLCRARFSSELGGSVPTQDGEIIVADAKCESAYAGTYTAMVFIRDGGRTRSYYFESDKAHTEQVRTLRDRVSASLK